ncbi:MAG: hypothetical protein QXM39_04950 [Thermoplasmata archaeon]
MKKLIKTLILGFFVLNFLYGEEGEIELVPVYEKTFPDTIVDVIFDTATVSIEEAKNLGWKVELIPEEEKKDGKMVICSPKVVFYKDKIEILNKEGEIKKRIDLKEVGIYESKEGEKEFTSYAKFYKGENNKYFCVVYTHRAEFEGYPIDGTLIMYNKKGEELWRVRGEIFSVEIYPSPNGEYAVGMPPEVYEGHPPFIIVKMELID